MFTQMVSFRIAATLAMTSVLVLPRSTNAQGTKLSYQPKQGLEVVYQVNIAVEDGDEMVKFDGLIRYTVTAVNADSFSLTYRGGLSETKQTKPGAGGSQNPRRTVLPVRESFRDIDASVGAPGSGVAGGDDVQIRRIEEKTLRWPDREVFAPPGHRISLHRNAYTLIRLGDGMGGETK